MIKTDFLIIGAGIIGIAVARELRHRHPGASIRVIEKEAIPAFHASGRNSGVLHAGFYYTADSLKAKFTRDGNRLLTDYCDSNGLPIRRVGKLVVAQSEADLPQLDELLRRAERNSVELHMVDEKQAREFEPRVKTVSRALWSPSTSCVDPVKVVNHMMSALQADGVNFLFDCAYVGRTSETAVLTSKGAIEAGHVINAAGGYADKIARDFGVGEHYRILPFKGLYLYSSEPVGSLRTNIYPVPDLRNPFLGVHFSVTVDGKAKIGPTAIPALWREQYDGLSRFNLAEFGEIVMRQAGLMVSADFDFRKLAGEELLKHFRSRLVGLSGRLLHGVESRNFKIWGRPGIRAQLVDTRTRRLEMDFKVESGPGSTHILNAVSPAFTCSIPFAQYVCDRVAF